MSLYDNDKCPVCGKQFAEGDDIVTCPVCGTPHHRECYKSNGKCANESRHSEGFEFKRASLQEPVQNKNDEKETQKSPVIFENLGRDFQGRLDNSSPLFKKTDGEASENKDGAQNFTVNGQNAFVFNKDEKIDDVYLEDVITSVGTNFTKFVDKFRKNKKINWNWSAFIFGPYYFFFRKMHGQGVLFLAIEFFARMMVSVFYSTQLNTLMNDIMSISTSQSSAQIMKQMSDALTTSGAAPAYYIIFGILLVIHIIIAMIADGFYRRRVINSIKNIDSKMENDGNIMINPLMSVGSEDLSKKELRKLVIASKGGVSFFAPCIAYIVLTLISDLASYL